MASRHGAGKAAPPRRKFLETILGSEYYRRKRLGALALYDAVRELDRSTDEELESLPDDDPGLVAARELQRRQARVFEPYTPVCGGGCGDPLTPFMNVARPITWVENPVGLCEHCADRLAAADDPREALSGMPALKKNPLVAIEGLAVMAATYGRLAHNAGGCRPVANTLESAHAEAKRLRGVWKGRAYL